jgi:hypothetical protein
MKISFFDENGNLMPGGVLGPSKIGEITIGYLDESLGLSDPSFLGLSMSSSSVGQVSLVDVETERNINAPVMVVTINMIPRSVKNITSL